MYSAAVAVWVQGDLRNIPVYTYDLDIETGQEQGLEHVLYMNKFESKN